MGPSRAHQVVGVDGDVNDLPARQAVGEGAGRVDGLVVNEGFVVLDNGFCGDHGF